MEKIYIDDKLWMIKNFLTKEELDIIYTFCLKESNWKSEVGGGHWKGNTAFTTDSQIVTKCMDNIIKRIHDVIDTEEIKISTNRTILRFVAQPENDVSMTAHHDMSTKYTTHGVVIYFNDNFEGGEIEYINKEISIKPEAGMLICHPAGKAYTHQVATVTSGTRYMGTYFVYEKEYFDLTPEELGLAYDSFDRETAPY